jgi:transcriptional regulator with XRE-family HTH domain
MVVPFGQTLFLWRLERGMTQEALARRARIPRPNLSAIERGKREASLRTIRALAGALRTAPGVLVDGIAPQAHRHGPLPSSRDTIERIADAVAFNRVVTDPREQAAVEALTLLIGPRTQAIHRQWRRSRRGRRAVLNAWRTLTSLCSREAISTLLDRVTERQRTHGPEAH